MANMSKFNVLPSLQALNRTAAAAAITTYSGATVDLQPYTAPGGRQLKAVLNVGLTTSTGTLNVRLQESSTTAEAGFANLTNTSVFTTTASSASLSSGVAKEEILFRTNNRYVRAVAELSNTGNADFGVYIVAERRLT
jgi:hypothetical protein